MKLNQLIRDGKLHLTEKEKAVLQAIRNEGSFFEESGGNDEVRERGSAFFGWQIDNSDVGGFNPAGVVASLVKKKVLGTMEDDGLTGYYMNYELDFAEDDNYRIIFEGEE